MPGLGSPVVSSLSSSRGGSIIQSKERLATLFRPIYPRLLALLSMVSMVGFFISLWAHLEALTGRDPGIKFGAFWQFQLLLFSLLLPLIVELFSTRNPSRILRSPRWMKIVLYLFLAYYGLTFYVFLYWSVNHLNSSATWRMFSAGWLLLFGLTAVYYSVRFSEAKG